MKLRRIFATINITLLLSLLCLRVFAAGNIGILNLKCSMPLEDRRLYFAGDEFSIVKIADAEVLEQTDVPEIRYSTLPDYMQQDCDWADLSAEESRTKAKELAAVAVRSDTILDSVIVDQEGRGSFTGLEPALYLVVRTQAAPQNASYSADPFLVSVPMIWEGELVYTVTSSPKYGWTPEPVEPTVPPTEPEDPSLPETGQLKWPIPVLLISGAAFVVAGWRKYRQE